MKVRVERDIVHPINNKELFVHCGKSNITNWCGAERHPQPTGYDTSQKRESNVSNRKSKIQLCPLR